MQEEQEKAELKALIEDKMGDLYDKDLDEKGGRAAYGAEEYGIPYNMVFEKDGTLVVGIDPDKALEFRKAYTEEDIKKDLGTDKDIDIVYTDWSAKPPSGAEKASGRQLQEVMRPSRSLKTERSSQRATTSIWETL